jgi:hypothetical protein
MLFSPLLMNEAYAHSNLPPEVTDAATHRAYDGISNWIRWLRQNNVRGWFGETGWYNRQDPFKSTGRYPTDRDILKANVLGRKVYSWLDDANVPVSFWSASVARGYRDDARPGTGYPAYGAVDYNAPYGERVLGVARSQAHVIEDFHSRPRRGVLHGVNVAGSETYREEDGRPRFSNESPGIYGYDYMYQSKPSYEYLFSRGHRLVRILFRWERLQPKLGGPLNMEEVQRLRDTVYAAGTSGLKVVLNLHDRFGYQFPDGGFPLGSNRVTQAHFVDFWKRFHALFDDRVNVLGYDLMNEPGWENPMPGNAVTWEKASQAAVTALRRLGSKKRIYVSGYFPKYNSRTEPSVWSFTKWHPKAWINDPLHNTWYTAHGYWLSYDKPYADSNQTAINQGYAVP